MGEAIFFAIICVFVFLGIQKIVEILETYSRFEFPKTSVLLCKISGHQENAEFIIRSLAADSLKISSCKKNAVFIIDDGMDEYTYKICIKTANQYKNVFIGNLEDAENILNTVN